MGPTTEGVELEAAAAVPVVYGTAELALQQRACLREGKILKTFLEIHMPHAGNGDLRLLWYETMI
jgi:hypothetical protein